MKRKYRIRQLREHSYYSNGCIRGIKKKMYSVEKRILWFFWKPEDLGVPGFNIFLNYEEACNFINKRNGKLIFSI